MNGYIGKILFVDLSTGETEVRELTEELVRAYPGGAGLGARILYEEMPANTPVFAPESMLGFVCGALNGSGGLMTCRYTVVSKSPVTNGWNDANAGGSFGDRRAPIARRTAAVPRTPSQTPLTMPFSIALILR